MLGAPIPPVPPSTGPASGEGLVLLAVVIAFIVLAAGLSILWARRAKDDGRESEYDVETYGRAA